MQEGSQLGRTKKKPKEFDLKETAVAGEVSKAEWTNRRSLTFVLFVMGTTAGF